MGNTFGIGWGISRLFHLFVVPLKKQILFHMYYTDIENEKNIGLN